MRFFEQATKLDPDYINAWKHMSSLVGKVDLPDEKRLDITANLIRLDPSGSHVNHGAITFGYDQIWKTIDALPQVPEVDLPGDLLRC